ncbi:hypothetical protein [Cohnella soli]|uniref:Oligosaccharide repeat unit polymerase n=1 Tax=Cohnella soli TaxID=425005 RepID=A0ABW0HWU3_9BACL
MSAAVINPRFLLASVFVSSTGVWLLYKPMFSFVKYYSLHAFTHYLLFYSIILISCFVVEKMGESVAGDAWKRRFDRVNSSGSLRKEALTLAGIAFAAQWLWILRMVAAKGTGTLVRMVFIDGDILKFKEQIVNATGIPGVTTLTQLSLIASGLYAIHVFGLRNKSELWIWALVLFPGILRGMLFSERIAMLEVLLPIIVFAIYFNKLKVTLFKASAAVMGVILFFSAAEGLRSYRYYSETGVANEGVYGYGIGRFLDYIGSSVNHSMAMVDLSDRAFGFPTLLLNGWINFAYAFIPESTIRTFLHMNESLQAYLNVKNSVYSAPDYTNMGFFGEVFASAGYLYAFYAVLYGCFIGLAYRGIKRYEVGWMAVYPIVVFSLLESYRVPYLFDNRVFYPLLYVALRYAYFSFLVRKGRAAGGSVNVDASASALKEAAVHIQ